VHPKIAAAIKRLRFVDDAHSHLRMARSLPVCTADVTIEDSNRPSRPHDDVIDSDEESAAKMRYMVCKKRYSNVGRMLRLAKLELVNSRRDLARFAPGFSAVADDDAEDELYMPNLATRADAVDEFGTQDVLMVDRQQLRADLPESVESGDISSTTRNFQDGLRHLAQLDKVSHAVRNLALDRVRGPFRDRLVEAFKELDPIVRRREVERLADSMKNDDVRSR
jgi:hypothetical protein